MIRVGWTCDSPSCDWWAKAGTSTLSLASRIADHLLLAHPYRARQGLILALCSELQGQEIQAQERLCAHQGAHPTPREASA